MKSFLPRNGAAVAAQMRQAGPMKDKRLKRNNEKKGWEEEPNPLLMKEIMEDIDISVPVIKFAHGEMLLPELGQEIASIVSEHSSFQEEPRLQRIRDKFLSVEDEERFDMFLNDLMFWCNYNKCKLIMPGAKE